MEMSDLDRWLAKRNLNGHWSRQRRFAQIKPYLVFFAILIGLVPLSSFPFSAKALEVEPGESKSEWDRVVAAAKKEGRVTVYAGGGAAAADREKIYRHHFEAAFPEITVVYAALGSVGTRIMTERRAERFIPDVYLGAPGSDTLPGMIKGGVYQPLRPSLLLPEVLDKSKWFRGKLWFADEGERFSLIYSLAVLTNVAVNTNSVKPKEITSYKHLLDPKWRGKIVSRDLKEGGTGSNNVKFLYLNQELGPGFLKKLFGEMDVTLSRDARQMIDWLGMGRFAIYLFPVLREVDHAKGVGIPVDVVNPLQMREGYAVTAGPNAIHLLNPSPHPNAAKVFINWLLSREGQTALEKIAQYPSLRTDTPTKALLRDSIVPRADDNFMVVNLERYWHLDAEVRQLLKSVGR